MSRTLSLAATAVLLVLVASGTGCGGSPRRPSTPPVPPVPPSTIQTEAGTLTVVAEGCVPDLETMTREVNGVVKRSGLTAPLAGWTFYVRMPDASRRVCEDAHGDACIDTSARAMNVWCPVAAHQAGGVEHEVGHALAYVAGLGCWREIGHGIGFDCRRTR